MNSGARRPKPPLIKMHGGAGSGKSTVIKAISAMCEYWMALHNNDSDPDRPAVVKLAPTGRAASEIDGLTLHSALNFKFGNEYTSLPDQLREQRRNQLSNLTILIVDEMSMVKADLLYQLYLRLKEIMQTDLDFGGISVILAGDLPQLRPINGSWIFEPPRGERNKDAYEVYSLWDLFEPLELTFNHRQGSDKEYADLLNRVRIGAHTKEDEMILKSRLSDELPDDALYVYGKNAPVRQRNEEYLAKLDGDMEVFKATNVPPKGTKSFRAKIGKDGRVGESPFLNELKLKVGARTMLTFNVATHDKLINGSMGKVTGFRKHKGKIEDILIRFDNSEDGKQRRARNAQLLKQLGKPDDTPINRVSFSYSIGKSEKQHSAKAKVIQFPLTQAWAITGHKCQGYTLRAPKALVADLSSCFATGQAYVMLSRIQNLSQLHLLSFDPKKIKTCPKAVAEAKKIKEDSIVNKINDDWIKTNSVWNGNNPAIRRILSLNIRNLPSNLPDILCDEVVLKSDIICLQETWCHLLPQIQGYTGYKAGEGQGKGVAIFVKNSLVSHIVSQPQSIVKPYAQILKLSFADLDVITVYKSPNEIYRESFQEFVQVLSSILTIGKPSIVNGDFNIDYLKQPNNSLSAMMTGNGFKQIVREATNIHGSCVDHAYLNKGFRHQYRLHYPYYTDHEAVCVMLKK